MKRALFLLLNIMFISSNCFADQGVCRISRDEIEITENGIILNLEGIGNVSVNAIYRDAKGFYIKDEFFKIWKCGNCGKFNHEDDNPYRCQWCNSPR